MRSRNPSATLRATPNKPQDLVLGFAIAQIILLVTGHRTAAILIETFKVEISIVDLATLQTATIAILAIVGTKATEKIGQGLGDKVLEEGGKLVRLLQNKFPNTLKTIEAVEEDGESLGRAIEEMEAVAESDREVAKAVEAVATAAKAEPQSIQNITNIEKNIEIGGLGSTFTGDFNFY